ncbi:hypothetical protein RRG08_039167 [Elysia crispata]|uniref:Uncharacterized protein n=1 Tax=Elysia crispata TaxID=231223 RepID=A0AAE0ZEL8_9GAST|nr:hypothetical protein RRG08_039167 [Elysia crispata]
MAREVGRTKLHRGQKFIEAPVRGRQLDKCVGRELHAETIIGTSIAGEFSALIRLPKRSALLRRGTARRLGRLHVTGRARVARTLSRLSYVPCTRPSVLTVSSKNSALI